MVNKFPTDGSQLKTCCFGTTAVSYTHLDVYKRQYSYCARLFLARFLGLPIYLLVKKATSLLLVLGETAITHVEKIKNKKIYSPHCRRFITIPCKIN